MIPQRAFAKMCYFNDDTNFIKCSIDASVGEGNKVSITSYKCEATEEFNERNGGYLSKTVLDSGLDGSDFALNSEGKIDCAATSVKTYFDSGAFEGIYVGHIADKNSTRGNLVQGNERDISKKYSSGSSGSYKIISDDGSNPGCGGIFGDVKNDGRDGSAASIAYILQKIFNYMKILGPLLVIVLSGFEFAKIVLTGDDEAMAKARSKLIIRLILVILLFIIPYLVQFILGLINGSLTDPTCGIM